MRALFDKEVPGSMRRFSREQYRNAGPILELGTDATPRGLGGWRATNGTIKHHYYCAVADHDLQILDIQRGSCTGQQVLEGLAILVALRLWHDQKSEQKAQIEVRGDNVASLTLLLKMRQHTTQQAIIARELA